MGAHLVRGVLLASSRIWLHPQQALSTLFIPGWLPIVSLLLATLVGALSGLYPALKAATLEPVAALKYE